MSFKHEIETEERIIETTDKYTAEINGYDVIFTFNERDGAELRIYPIKSDRLKLGIIQCRPRSVEDLEKFAEEAGDLLKAIALELRDLGKDDLRDKYEIANAKLKSAFG